MVSFEGFRMEDGSPIYAQIIQYVQRGIVARIIRDQDEMPSRRVLSALLGVNPNTIQKAYRMLEEDHIIESRSGAKSYITIDGGQIARIRANLLETDARTLVRAMKQMGISKAEALALVEKAWEERNEV